MDDFRYTNVEPLLDFFLRFPLEDYILDTIRIGMKSDTVLDPETVIDFLCNISDGGFELYDPKFEIYFNSGITYGADNLEFITSY